jgi:hypothetical protein
LQVLPIRCGKEKSTIFHVAGNLERADYGSTRDGDARSQSHTKAATRKIVSGEKLAQVIRCWKLCRLKKMKPSFSRLILTLNLLLFCACAWVFYRRNGLLFNDWDGIDEFAKAFNQSFFSAAGINLSNDFLQEIGNIQYPQNYRLLPMFWPIFLVSDINTATLMTYVSIGALLFLTTYMFSRQLGAARPVSLVAAWWLSILITPYVPPPLFYHLLSITPSSVFGPVYPALILSAIIPIGRVSFRSNLILGLILLMLGWYLITAAPIWVVGAMPPIAIYGLAACCMVRFRAELFTKLSVLLVVAVIMTILLWPIFVLSLTMYTAPYLFPQDFVVDYRNNAFDLSIMFEKDAFGWGGPLLVIFAVIGALLSMKAKETIREQRVAAWLLLIIVAMILALRSAIQTLPLSFGVVHIKYFEFAAWPLYAMFAATAIFQLVSAGAERVAKYVPVSARLICSEWLVLALTTATAFAIPWIHSPRPRDLRLPPATADIVQRLRTEIGLTPFAPFRGRVATIMPITPLPVDQLNGLSDPVVQQQYRAIQISNETGNDHFGPGLWYFQIPTLFEYNLLISPAFHALAKRTLYSLQIPHLRNNLLVTIPNERILKLLGVRFVILVDPNSSSTEALPEIGRWLETVMVGPERWRLFGLDAPNLGTYSPTILTVSKNLDQALDTVASDATDVTKQAVVQSEIPGRLVPALETSLSIVGGDLHFSARSNGRSLVVLPLEYSRCIEMRPGSPSSSIDTASLHRVDGLLTGVLFDREINVVLQFRIGPLHNPLCRFWDYRDFKSLTE